MISFLACFSSSPPPHTHTYRMTERTAYFMFDKQIRFSVSFLAKCLNYNPRQYPRCGEPTEFSFLFSWYPFNKELSDPSCAIFTPAMAGHREQSEKERDRQTDTTRLLWEENHQRRCRCGDSKASGRRRRRHVHAD